MEVNEVRISKDKDFEDFNSLVHSDDGWGISYSKNNLVVKTKWTDESRIKLIKVSYIMENVTLNTLYDALHDPEYRKVWDKDMADSYDICKLNDNNVIGWYAAKMPPPLKYRDWCLLRTWKMLDDEFMIFNHSVEHNAVPVRKNFVRSISYLTGYYGKRISKTSTQMIFLTQTDPKGKLPKWFVNFLSTVMAPRIMKKLYKTTLGYEKWRSKHGGNEKPWLQPELSKLPMLNKDDIPSHSKLEDEFEIIEDEELDETSAEMAEDLSNASDE